MQSAHVYTYELKIAKKLWEIKTTLIWENNRKFKVNKILKPPSKNRINNKFPVFYRL